MPINSCLSAAAESEITGNPKDCRALGTNLPLVPRFALPSRDERYFRNLDCPFPYWICPDHGLGCFELTSFMSTNSFPQPQGWLFPPWSIAAFSVPSLLPLKLLIATVGQWGRSIPSLCTRNTCTCLEVLIRKDHKETGCREMLGTATHSLERCDRESSSGWSLKPQAGGWPRSPKPWEEWAGATDEVLGTQCLH